MPAPDHGDGGRSTTFVKTTATSPSLRCRPSTSACCATRKRTFRARRGRVRPGVELLLAIAPPHSANQWCAATPHFRCSPIRPLIAKAGQRSLHQSALASTISTGSGTIPLRLALRPAGGLTMLEVLATIVIVGLFLHICMAVLAQKGIWRGNRAADDRD